MPAAVEVFGSYTLSVVGVGVLARRQMHRRTVLDAAIVTISVGVLLWVAFIADHAVTPGLSLPQRLITVAHPVLDLLLLAAALPLALTVGRSPRTLLLLGWVTLQLCGDMVFNVQVLHGSFRFGGTVFGWWLLSFAVLSAAALYPYGVPGLSPLVIEDVVDQGEMILTYARTPSSAVACPGCGALAQRVTAITNGWLPGPGYLGESATSAALCRR